MKVYIGKYRNRLRCNIYNNYMNKKYGLVKWPTKQSNFENFVEKLDDYIQDFLNIFNKLYFDRRKDQIKYIKIDNWDIWSMDHTLADIILPMLKKLRENKHGSPIVDDEDVPAHYPRQQQTRNEGHQLDMFADENSDNLIWSQYEVRWNYVLDEMIWAFEQKLTDWESQFHSGEIDRITVPVDAEGNEVPESEAEFFEWRTGPNDTSEIDWAGRKAHQLRMNNGFRLFGKYYEGLWT